MTPEQWAAIIAIVGGAGGGVGFFFKVITAIARDMVAAQKETTAAVSDLRTDIVSLRTRVDTLIDVMPTHQPDREESREPSSVRGSFPLRGRKES